MIGQTRPSAPTRRVVLSTLVSASTVSVAFPHVSRAGCPIEAGLATPTNCLLPLSICRALPTVPPFGFTILYIIGGTAVTIVGGVIVVVAPETPIGEVVMDIGVKIIQKGVVAFPVDLLIELW